MSVLILINEYNKNIVKNEIKKEGVEFIYLINVNVRLDFFENIKLLLGIGLKKIKINELSSVLNKLKNKRVKIYMYYQDKNNEDDEDKTDINIFDIYNTIVLNREYKIIDVYFNNKKIDLLYIPFETINNSFEYQLYLLFKKYRKLSVVELKRKLNKKSSQIVRYLSMLVEKKIIRKIDSGIYELV